MMPSSEKNQKAPITPTVISPPQARVHWTSVVSFTFGLFVLLGGIVVFSFPAILGIFSFATKGFEPELVVAIIGVLLYVFFGLGALRIARRPVWRRGLAFARLGYGCSLVLLLVLVIVLVFTLILFVLFSNSHMYSGG